MFSIWVIWKKKEKEGRKKGSKEIFDVIIAKNFPKLMADMKPYIQSSTLRGKKKYK